MSIDKDCRSGTERARPVAASRGSRSLSYELHESKKDREIAGEITRLARALDGVLMLGKPIVLTKPAREQGWTEERWVAMRLASAKALARYQVRLALRSSRAALWEHLRGTEAAGEKCGVRPEKEDTGDVIARLQALQDREAPGGELSAFLPEWLKDTAAFARACRGDLQRYEAIAGLCDELSAGREEAKVRLLVKLLKEHDLVLAFDSRPITLAVLEGMLKEESEPGVFEVFMATGGRPADRKAVQRAFEIGGQTRSAVALCSNSMSEGINLQRASAIVHLDMPSVVRIAEQRVGRIDRMDSPHARVESWWPSDAEEFALATDELLGARLELVGDVLGSNLDLPEGKVQVVRPAEMVEEVQRHEREQVQLLTDAFAPVRGLVEGEAALVEHGVYEAVRRSKARVLSAVSVVRVPAGASEWGFFAIAGTKTTAPRWAFVDGGAGGFEGDGAVATDLGVVAGRLRERLVGVEDVELDDGAMAVMTGLLERLERGAIGLFPRRKRRALAQMEEVLAGWEGGEEERGCGARGGV